MDSTQETSQETTQAGEKQPKQKAKTIAQFIRDQATLKTAEIAEMLEQSGFIPNALVAKARELLIESVTKELGISKNYGSASLEKGSKLGALATKLADREYGVIEARLLKLQIKLDEKTVKELEKSFVGAYMDALRSNVRHLAALTAIRDVRDILGKPGGLELIEMPPDPGVEAAEAKKKKLEEKRAARRIKASRTRTNGDEEPGYKALWDDSGSGTDDTSSADAGD